jgi:putative MATE family efflux protein
LLFRTNIKFSEITRIAYPIILGSIAQNILSVTNTAFLGRVGEVELGAGAIGGVYYFVVVMLAWGFGIGLQIIVARRNGEGKLSEIGRTIDHGVYFLVPLAIITFSLMKFFSEGILSHVLESEDILNATVRYIHYRSYGVFFAFAHVLFRAFYVGVANTRVITYSTFILTIVNAFLDYCLIFGHFGFPEMGIEGAGISSVIAELIAALYFIYYTRLKFSTAKYHLFHFVTFDLKLYIQIIRVSLPMMLQNFLSLASWLVFFLLVEKMGQRELAISNIIRSFYMLMMIPMWGLAAAVNTLVSFLIGSKRQDEVMQLVYKVVILCLAGVGVMVIIGSFLPHFAVMIYTNDATMITEALPVVYVVNAAALMLAAAFIFFSAVSGTGKTQVSFIIEVLVLIIYLGYAWYIIMVAKSNISVVWAAECVYSLLLGSLSFWYLKSGKWKGSVV